MGCRWISSPTLVITKSGKENTLTAMPSLDLWIIQFIAPLCNSQSIPRIKLHILWVRFLRFFQKLLLSDCLLILFLSEATAKSTYCILFTHKKIPKYDLSTETWLMQIFTFPNALHSVNIYNTHLLQTLHEIYFKYKAI